MIYTLEDLKKDLAGKLLSLEGSFDNDFINNPAFASSLGEIQNIISFLNISNPSDIQVYQTDNDIKFEVNDGSDKKVTLKISRVDNTEINAVALIYDVKNNNKQVYSRNIKFHKHENLENSIVKVNCDNVMLQFTSPTDRNGKVANGNIEKVYNSNGINISANVREYGWRDVTFVNNAADVIASTVLEYANRTSNDIYLEARKDIQRKYLDIANVTYKTKDSTYVGPMLLNSEHSLREIMPENHVSDNIEIKPLSKQEIEFLISKEPNPMIRKGLEEFAKDRDKFYYNSANDINFRCEQNKPNVR